MNDYQDKQEYIQSQYSNSPTIKKILNDFRDAILPDVDIDTFYKNIMDIDTASGIGLDIWGRIVGIDRYIVVNDTTSTTPLFGFNGSKLYTFDNGVFYSEYFIESGNKVIATLDDDNFRRIILFKAFSNISDCSLKTLNTLSKLVFDTYDLQVTNINVKGTLKNGDVYNSYPMHVRWIWRVNNLSNIDRAIFNQYVILSLSAGVGYTVNVISKDPVFGFYGSELTPFNQGNFATVFNL